MFPYSSLPKLPPTPFPSLSIASFFPSFLSLLRLSFFSFLLSNDMGAFLFLCPACHRTLSVALPSHQTSTTHDLSFVKPPPAQATLCRAQFGPAPSITPRHLLTSAVLNFKSGNQQLPSAATCPATLPLRLELSLSQPCPLSSNPAL